MVKYIYIKKKKKLGLRKRSFLKNLKIKEASVSKFNNLSNFKYDDIYIFLFKLKNIFIKKGKKNKLNRLFLNLFFNLNRLRDFEVYLKKNIYIQDIFVYSYFFLRTFKGIKSIKGYSSTRYIPKYLSHKQSISISLKWVKNSLNSRRFRESLLQEVVYLLKFDKFSKIILEKKELENLFLKNKHYMRRVNSNRYVKNRVKTVKRL